MTFGVGPGGPAHARQAAWLGRPAFSIDELEDVGRGDLLMQVASDDNITLATPRMLLKDLRSF